MGPGFESPKAHQSLKIWASVVEGVENGPLVKRSRHRPLTPVTGVRFSHGSPNPILTIEYVVGEYCGEGPPVPIPNTEVKLTCADNTWLETAREDKASPTSYSTG